MVLPFPMAATIRVQNINKVAQIAQARFPEYVQCGSIDCESVCKVTEPSGFRVLAMNPGDQIQVTGMAYTVEHIQDDPFNRPQVQCAKAELWVGGCKKSQGGGKIAETTTCCCETGFFLPLGSYKFVFTVNDTFVNIAKSADSTPTLFVKITDGNAFGMDVSDSIGYSREVPIAITTSNINPITGHVDTTSGTTLAGTIPSNGRGNFFNCGFLQPVCNAAVVIGVLAAIGVGVYIASPAIRASVGAARGAVKKRVSRKRNSKSA